MNKFDVLKKYFGYNSFRNGQEELIDNILIERDVLGIMPTGAGKSLCYQIPAMLMDGITIVISPLISLMKDQVSSLIEVGINAACINSSLMIQEYNEILRRAYNGNYKIIYVAPERLDTEDFLNFAEKAKISMITVDEAHCVSQWGQDFRPSYLRIVEFIEKLSYRPIVSAFTATATKEVRDDIERILKLNSPYTITTGFDRKNLYFGVIKPSNKYLMLIELLKNYPEKCGIIYCLSRKNVEEVCEKLVLDGFSVTRYHAGLSKEERRINQDDFIYDRKQIIVATNAFGMGIDKSNVSFVIHYNMPKNIESYYQEAGRAGRDGEPADCIILYNGQDVRTNRFLIDSSFEKNTELSAEETEEVHRKDLERLKLMTLYCTADECLRAFILKYFGEHISGFCNNCSYCKGEFELTDITLDAQKIISCVYRIHQKKGMDYGKTMTIDVLKGSKNEKLISAGLNTVSTYGIMSDITQKTLRLEIEWLVNNGYLLITENEYPVLKLSAKSADVLKGNVKLQMKFPKKLPKKEKTTAKYQEKKNQDIIEDELFSELRKLRTKLAAEENVPAYIIFADASLKDMCQKMPVDIINFLDVKGVGKHKAEKYGNKFCSLISEYIKNHS